MSLLKKFFVSSKEEDNQLPPLHLAALIDDYERVKLIIEDDISAVEALDEMDKKPLHYAAKNGHLNIFMITYGWRMADWSWVPSPPVYCIAPWCSALLRHVLR